ncbi:MAG: PAP/fibrillin family protein [Woeseiaceae bacterium]
MKQRSHDDTDMSKRIGMFAKAITKPDIETMQTAADIKKKILSFVDGMDETVLVSEDEKNHLRALCDELCPMTPTPRPIEQQEVPEGVWLTRFASFGAKHSDNQPPQHDTNLMLQSFGNLPKVPARVTKLHQEIEQASKAYNNVVYVQNPAGDTKAVIVLEGVYSGDEENPQRYSVAFHRVGLRALDGQSDDELRAGFGINADTPLSKEFRPPKLHSDIVYVDDDIRINYGSLGGFYLLQRINTPGFSVPLNP